MSTVIGTVMSGANNIFHVCIDGRTLQCRFKGKVLRSVENEYNPLAPGDLVELAADTEEFDEPRIVARVKRRNSVTRWNRKRRAIQTLAANVDYVAVIGSARLPPFRPRFIDRVLAACELGDCQAVVVINKIDQGLTEECVARLDAYRDLGYRLFEASAGDGGGLDELREWLHGRTVALIGQSGVGKSTLINVLIPGVRQRTGEVSAKYRRGRHVTSGGVLLQGAQFSLIDTPGIREIDLYPHQAVDIAWAFREFRGVKCEFSPCTHLHEPGCGVRRMVERGEIDSDRYTSYQNIVADRQISASRLGATRAG